MNKKNVLRLAQTAILLAIIVVMAFTPVGYLKIGPLSISFMTIPVVIGAMVIGPGAGAILGTAFGITSFCQAFLGDVFAATLFDISAVRYFIMCIPTRTLMGLCTGLIFKALRGNGVSKTWHYFFNGFIGCLLNAVFFLGGP